MADGTIQVPPDSTGSKVDGASLPVGGNTVIRQRMVIGDNSATAQFATVTGGALLVQHNTGIAISGTVALAAGAANIGTINNISAAVVLAAGAANIGIINNISATVNTVVGAGTALIGAVSLGAGTANIGFINGISATVNVLITAGTNLIGAVSNAAGTALMGAVSLAAGTANIGFINGISAPVVLAAGTANIGTINGISATISVVNAAGTANIGSINNISATVVVAIAGFYDASGNAKSLIDSANIALRVVGAGTNGSINIGGFADSSGQNRNVVDSVNLALRVTVSTPLNVNAISQTVTVVTALPWVVAQPSNSHGPLTLQISTSATVTLITAPGAGLHVYITELVVTNGGSVLTGSQVGPTGSIGQVTMIAGASGGGSRMSFDPPWKLQSNTAAICRVDPNPLGNFYFVVNFFVAA